MDSKEETLKALGWSDELIKALLRDDYDLNEIEDIILEEQEKDRPVASTQFPFISIASIPYSTTI